MKDIYRALLCCTAIFTPGCDAGSIFGRDATDVRGVYGLVSAGKEQVPISTGRGARWDKFIAADTLLLSADGTFTRAQRHIYENREFAGIDSDRVIISSGGFDISGRTGLTLVPESGPAISGRLDGETVVLRETTLSGGSVPVDWVFERAE